MLKYAILIFCLWVKLFILVINLFLTYFIKSQCSGTHWKLSGILNFESVTTRCSRVTFCFGSGFRFLHFQCSKSCGDGGYQHRQVRCQSHTGEILADMFCSALERPNEQHMCDLPQCHISYSDSNLKPVTKEYQWRTGIWSQVSFLLYLLRTYWCSCLHNKY